jgi:hypothetical protein
VLITPAANPPIANSTASHHVTVRHPTRHVRSKGASSTPHPNRRC